MRIFGFDIGVTSIGFAVIDYQPEGEAGKVLQMGVRIFPEARDPDGTPLNQQRRQKRMMRRQLRRRRQRRRLLNELLCEAGLLPPFSKTQRTRGHSKTEWEKVMALDPYALRALGLSEKLRPYDFGRALYHLSKRRHFKGRDLVDDEDTNVDKSSVDTKPQRGSGKGAIETISTEEAEAKKNGAATLTILQAEGKTLGQWLETKKASAAKGVPPTDRRRGVHAHRNVVEEEFEKLWRAQAEHHPTLKNGQLKARIQDAIFAQRPVFWRKNTLGECRFMPGEALCPKGAWLSQQKRMLEKLNNLAVVGGNARPLDDEERAAILRKLQTQVSMTWGGVQSALAPLYKARGEPGGQKSLKFNLEIGGDSKINGNPLEAKLVGIFGKAWAGHPNKQAIRDAVHERLWQADYGEIGDQRVVILSSAERVERRAYAVQSLIDDFGVTKEEAAQLKALKLPTGWEPFSMAALKAFLPHLEVGVRFGALVSGPEWHEWRNETFPNREQPTGEILDRLPSPNRRSTMGREEQRRIAKLRNPTVVRTQNELRKVTNNLIRVYGKPHKIRVEVGRDVGRSKREREEIKSVIRRNERERKKASDDLKSKGIDPSLDDITKWLLWKECGEFDPYSNQPISFDSLFRRNEFDIEHIWPRSKYPDNGFGNKTLCLKALNIKKANKTPFEAFGNDPEWQDMKDRMWGRVKARAMPKGKAVRFCREEPLPEDFASRQLNDTRYASKLILAQLKRLWPDLGPEAPVHVHAVTGSVTAQLRKLWNLNNILSDDGEKTRADHRHHAIDALVVACAHPGMTQKLSRYWQAKDDPSAKRPSLQPPWSSIRADAERGLEETIVSHRVQKKVSGPLHKETVYGDTGTRIKDGEIEYMILTKRRPVSDLSLGVLSNDNISKTTRNAPYVVTDQAVRRVIRNYLEKHGGDPKKAYPPYPRLSEKGPEIRKVRTLEKRQKKVTAAAANGRVELDELHHIAIFRLPDGTCKFELVKLFEAARRISQKRPVVRRETDKGEQFVMSLAPGDAVEFLDNKEIPIWKVCGAWSNGQVVLTPNFDARPTTKTEAKRLKVDGPRKEFRPQASTFLKPTVRKLSIDPIGRVRPAHD